ncbi:MAG: nucleoside triphosphate pyrophosphohydrolase [Alphaproteobacteria bacterium]
MSEPTTRLLTIMARLRDPESGCPWDIEQDFASIAPYTIEEAYEVADAIERDDMQELKSELGDLLLQVVFHSRIAEERKLFTYADVVDDIAEKMIRRHPNIFGDADDVKTAEDQTRAWEDHKEAERKRKAAEEGTVPSVLDGVALGLPALMRASKLTKRAARVGFDWTDPEQILGKLAEETQEFRDELMVDQPDPDRLEDELGDMLFVLCNIGRKLNIDP